jgi:hypothetical protein
MVASRISLQEKLFSRNATVCLQLFFLSRGLKILMTNILHHHTLLSRMRCLKSHASWSLPIPSTDRSIMSFLQIYLKNRWGGSVVYACGPTTWEVEVGGPLEPRSSRPAWEDPVFDWGCSSVVEHLPRLFETLSLIPSTAWMGRDEFRLSIITAKLCGEKQGKMICSSVLMFS